MGSDIFDDSDFVEHDNLRDESNSLKPERVAPSEFPHVPARVDDECEDKGSWQQHLYVGEVVAHYVVSLQSLNILTLLCSTASSLASSRSSNLLLI